MYIPGFKEIAASAAAFFRNRPGDDPLAQVRAADPTEQFLARDRDRRALERVFALLDERLAEGRIMSSDWGAYRSARGVIALEIAKRRRP